MKQLLSFLIIIMMLSNANCQRPEDTEDWSREPVVVTPAEGTQPPSDAILLYGGAEDIEKWVQIDGGPPAWEAGDVLTVVPGTEDIQTRRHFGDVQLHVEWRTPEVIEGRGQGRGNSGIFLMGLYEVQVLDSYENETYYNGQAGAIYKQHIPLVNACRPPGEWQTYDIFFTAPGFGEDGSLLSPAFITVVHNGVLIQNHVELLGPTLFIGKPRYEKHAEKLPLKLQEHSNPVSFRNIWIREL
ncbi:MAG TPA: DUF1080 domain-containing protein [Bacteroides sp.]|nr:DUF1080 domain-containing protein [Bacteroides sp.]